MTDWTGRLAVATPLLLDPNFARAVVLLLQVEPDDGALGLVLNRPTDTTVHEVLEDWGPLAGAPPVVFTGGPVQPNAAICLGRGRLDAPGVPAFSALENAPTLGTVDLDASPGDVQLAVSEVRLFAGYAGWGAGQLEAEVDEGAWWVLESLPSDAFTAEPALLWQRVLRRQGPPIAFAALYPEDPSLN